MDEKRKPFATIHFSKPSAAGIVAGGFAVVVFAVFMAADFLNERRHLEAQFAALQDSLSIAEMRASDLEQALKHSEADVRRLEERVGETEMRRGSSEVHFPMPLGFIDASDYAGPEFYFLSCARIVIENAQVSASYDRGLALSRYQVWDRAAVRNLLDTSEYELVGRESWSTDPDGDFEKDYYMRKDVTERISFEWPRHKSRDGGYWEFHDHLDEDCRRRN